MKVALEELKEESDSGRLAAGEIAPPRACRTPLLLAAVGLVLALALAALWLLRSQGTSQ